MKIYRVVADGQCYLVKAGNMQAAMRFVGDDATEIAETLLYPREFDELAKRKGYEPTRIIPLKGLDTAGIL